MTPQDRRWLADLAIAAGRLKADKAPDLHAATIEDAWSQVCEAAEMREAELERLVAERFELRVADLKDPDPAVGRLVPDQVHRERMVRALRRGRDGVEFAIADPTDADLPELLHFLVDAPVVLCIASPGAVRRSEAPEGQEAVAMGDGVKLIDVDIESDADPAVIRLSNQIFRQAVERGASDIHIQPFGAGGAIRMRIDGVLQRVAALQHSVMLRLVSRIKLISSMDPTDRMRPQDGRLRIRVADRSYDVRVSSVPANEAEKVVLRILGMGPVRTLKDVGIRQPELDQLHGLLSRQQGLVLLTGPTGSGKTTTLYGAIAERNDPDISIATVEEPVEIYLPWLAQISVNPKADLTFASALRSVLRQDPDVVMIGEIRDAETAEIAVRAAITGHLVLATLHANDALGAIPRLIDLGVTPQLLGEALIGACAQRLVRRLCTHCARPAPEASSAEAKWLAEYAAVTRFMEPVGCHECAESGYKGRLPLNQVFEFTPELAEMVEAGAPLRQLHMTAAKGGMRTLSESGLDLLRAAETSVDEVVRTLGGDFWVELAQVLNAPVCRATYEPRVGIASIGDSGLPVLVISRNPVMRARAAEALRLARHAVIEADSSTVAQQVLEKGAVAAIVVDLADAKPENVNRFMVARKSLGAAAIPILALRSDNPAIDRMLEGQPGVALRSRPSDGSLGALLQQATEELDHEEEAHAALHG